MVGVDAGRRAIPAQPIDWARIADWTARLVAGDIEAVKQAFRREGTGGPEVIWAPSVAQVPTEPLRFLADFWSAQTRTRALPHQDAVDALVLRPALGYVMLLDVVDDGLDFRYRLYGSTIADISGSDLTGRLLSEYPASNKVVEFNLAATRAALRRRVPLFSIRTLQDAQETKTWPRLALPFGDDDGTVTRVLVGTVAIRSDGTLVR